MVTVATLGLACYSGADRRADTGAPTALESTARSTSADSAASAASVNAGGTKMRDLARRLTALGYEGLFERLGDRELDALWGEPGMREQLDSLAVDASAPAEARFLAAELLFRKRPGYPPPAARAALAVAYAEALKGTSSANRWGLPGELDGAAGQHLVQLGDAAAAPLEALLSDNRRVQYAGSKEATVGNEYEYRVKDLAAFFLSRIQNVPYVVREQPAARDGEIERLRQSLLAARRG